MWSGSGGSAISDDNFARLLELKPDVVIETSASKSITEQQAQQLTEAEISYLVIPEPSSLGNVEVAVKTLGEVLGDKSGDGGSNAPVMADKYVSWVESAVNAASAASGSRPSTGDDEETFSNDFYTLYIDGWDDSAYYRLYSEQYTTLEGYGCAVVKNGATTSCKTISSYLSYAGVTNTGSLYGITSKSLYFTPLISAYRTMDITGSMADGMVTAGQKLLEQDNASLGTANFPILLAADRHTANAILSSELWAVYPHINSGDGSFNSDGFLDEDGNLVRTQISGEYEIVVNPCGLACSWISGSCESVLESVWAAWRFYGGLTESEVRDYISDFYSTFYSYELSSNEIDQILEGN